jgi:hypothetical protein
VRDIGVAQRELERGQSMAMDSGALGDDVVVGRACAYPQPRAGAATRGAAISRGLSGDGFLGA